MSVEAIINIILGVLSIAVTFLSYYLYIKAKITSAAVGAINEAEMEDKTGEEKMEFAVAQVYALVPKILKPILTKEVIKQLIQMAFDKIKAFAIKQNKESSNND